MDRLVNVRFFRVEGLRNDAPSFSAALSRIAAMPLPDREVEIAEEVIIRLERLIPADGLLSGELIRRQIANLPPHAPAGLPLARLGVDSLGHSSAFAYDPQLSVIALQMARNGVTSTRAGMYARRLVGGPGYDVLPIPTQEMWQKLQHGRIRAVRIRVAAPETLQAADANTGNVSQGLRLLKDALGTASVEAVLSAARGHDIPRHNVLSLLRWLQAQREEGRGDVRRLSASVVPPGGSEPELLNLLGGQVGRSMVLDLPDDDPDINYGIRETFLKQVFDEHRAELAEIFGRDEAPRQ
jgi:hypothetical protein